MFITKIIDLHIHSMMSDGIYSPKEIIDIAKKNNVSVISISDHDTIAAYSDELFDYAKDQGIILIPAVEISTKIDKCGIHVLGYNIDVNNNALKNKLYELRNSRHIYLKDVSNKLQELGYKINLEKLDEIDAVTKAHIALNIINDEDNKKILIKNFGHIPNKGEFIENLMNEGCPAYVKKITITPFEAAKLIKNAKGKVVLAHPVAYCYEDKLTDKDILKIVNDMKIDAVEACYVYTDKYNNIHSDVNHWLDFASKNNLYYTVGSDFHCDDKYRSQIGLINYLKLTDNQVDYILNFIFK